KVDFVGKRSFARVDTSRPDRRQLVALLPLDADALLREGSQLVPAPDSRDMQGHVTSSYRSAALGRTFALALVKSGRSRHGEVVYAVPPRGEPVAAEIVDAVVYDREG